jgi:predicted HTH domain antitoxin
LEPPQEIEQQLQAEWPDLERHILEGFAVEAFRQGKLSSYEVSKILGFDSRMEAIRFLSERGVYPGYDVEDFEEDRRTLDKLEER